MNVLNESLCIGLKIIWWKQKSSELYFGCYFAVQTG